MASNFIQAGQLTPIQGDIGQQSIVQSNEPTVDQLINPMLKTVDMAGDMYSESKAKSLVESEIENIDAARAMAESGQFTSGDAVPESLKLDQGEWDMLAGAVQSGSMPRETARLIASSRLRSRIAEEPFFADRMRKSASGVLGFNIESEGAQQYFNSFATKSEIASASGANKNKYLTGVEERAAAQTLATGVDFKTARNAIIIADRNADTLASLKNQKEMGQLSSAQFVSELSKIDNKEAFTGIMRDLAVSVKEGQPIDNIVVGNSIETKKQMFLSNMRDQYEGDINSPEFQRIEQSIIARYDGYNTLVQAVGIDNMTTSNINRMEQLRQQIGDKYMMDIQIINEHGGQEAVSQFFKLVGGDLNDTQKAQMLEQFPILKRFEGIANASPEELKRRLVDTTTAVITEKPLTPEQKEVIDPVVTESYGKGDEKSQDATIRSLRSNQMPTKANSLIATKSPTETSISNIKTFKRGFEKDVPLVFDKIGTLMAKHEGAFSTYQKEDGSIAIKFSNKYGSGEIGASSKRADAIDTLKEINKELVKVAPFWKSLDKGWDTELGVTKEEFAITAKKSLDTAAIKAEETQLSQGVIKTATDFANSVIAGDRGKARKLFDKSVELNPEAFPNGFEAMYDEIRRIERAKGE